MTHKDTRDGEVGSWNGVGVWQAVSLTEQVKERVLWKKEKVAERKSSSGLTKRSGGAVYLPGLARLADSSHFWSFKASSYLSSLLTFCAAHPRKLMKVVWNSVSLCFLCFRGNEHWRSDVSSSARERMCRATAISLAGIASCCSRLQLISSSCRETAHTMPSLWFPHCCLWFHWGAPQWQKWWRWRLWGLGGWKGDKDSSEAVVQFVSH